MYIVVCCTDIKGQALIDKRMTIDGLSPFSTYKFRVRAENILGMGDPSKESGKFDRNFFGVIL